MSAAEKKAIWILSVEIQNPLALAIVSKCVEYHKMKSGDNARQVEFKDILQWNKFSDGFPNLFIENVKEMAGNDVIFIASFHSVDVIFEQISMIYSIPRYLARSFTVILPYFPTGTMERVDSEGQVATAKTLSMMLSNIPPTARGPAQIMIFDIHALQERFYFSNDVIPRLETAVPLVIQAIAGTFDDMNTIAIAFPDDGAQKRFDHQFPKQWPRIVCVKIRNGDERQVRVKEGDPSGKNVIIIDDLVQSGGTLIEAGKVLKDAKALSVSAYATHAVFPKESWRRFIGDGKAGTKPEFDSFWITDSIPHARTVIGQHPPFKVLSLSSVIAQCLFGFDLKQ